MGLTSPGFPLSAPYRYQAEVLAAAAASMGVSEAALRGTLEAYGRLASQAQQQQQKGADAGAGVEGEGAAAGGGGAGGGGGVGGGAVTDEFGKRVFRNAPHPDTDLPMYVARVTPVVSPEQGCCT